MLRDRLLVTGLMVTASVLSWGLIWLIRQSTPVSEVSERPEMLADTMPMAVLLYLTGMALVAWAVSLPLTRRMELAWGRVQAFLGGMGTLWLGHLAGTLLVFLLAPQALPGWGHALCLPENVLQIPLPVYTLCVMGVLYFLPGLAAGGAAGWLFHEWILRTETQSG
jgi:hypothetical protein